MTRLHCQRRDTHGLQFKQQNLLFDTYHLHHMAQGINTVAPPTKKVRGEPNLMKSTILCT